MLKLPEITILYFLHLFANSADDCDDPGIPPGALRSGGRFFRGEKLTYRCQTGLDLLGSAERFCLEHREWSGSKPRCHGALNLQFSAFSVTGHEFFKNKKRKEN